MKPGIHPVWYPDAVVTCACGNTFTTGSTKKEIHTDVCSNCHPFFTGEQRIVDTAGQVERFMKRVSAKEQIAATRPAPEEKRAKKDKRRGQKPPFEVTPTVQAPVELPLAVVEEKPVVGQAPELPVIEEPAVEKVAPTARVELPMAEAKVEQAAPVEEIAEPTPPMLIEQTMPVQETKPVVEMPVAEKRTKPRTVKPKTTKKAPAKKSAARPRASLKKKTPARAKSKTPKKSKK